MTILHIDSSARLQNSVTRELSAHIVAHLGGDVIRRDLAQALPHLNEAWLTANWTPSEARTDAQRAALDLSDRLIDELHQVDTLVIGAPIYNFGIPAALKAWIDLIARAGITFKYTDQGPVGLLQNKRAIVALASGGTKIGSEIDFASGYLKHVLGFVGITDVTVIAADRIMASETAVKVAKAQVLDLVA